MDRFLYRAKSIEDVRNFNIERGDWVVGSPIVTRNGIKKLYVYSEELSNKNGIATYKYINVDSMTVCQCTGTKDEAGELVFENDIYFDEQFEEHFIIVFSDLAWRAEFSTSSIELVEMTGKNDVLLADKRGNTIDNPELVEV